MCLFAKSVCATFSLETRLYFVLFLLNLQRKSQNVFINGQTRPLIYILQILIGLNLIL